MVLGQTGTMQHDTSNRLSSSESAAFAANIWAKCGTQSGVTPAFRAALAEMSEKEQQFVASCIADGQHVGLTVNGNVTIMGHASMERYRG